MRFIDLFSGIGGFRLALEKQGGTCVFSSDIDKDALETYEKNFKERPAGDITKIAAKDIPKHDILCGGFPCQPFSSSGNKQGIDDKHKGHLIYHIARIAKYHKPDILILENVENIIKNRGGEDIKEVFHVLDNVGYDGHYSKLNAGWFGCIQARVRIYFVFIKKGSGIKYESPQPNMKLRVVNDILTEDSNEFLLVKGKRANPVNIQYKRPIYPVLNIVKAGLCGKDAFNIGKPRQGYTIHYPEGLCPTITATHMPFFLLTNETIRIPSIIETARLSGYPDNWLASTSYEKAKKQYGNTVIPKMIEYVYRGII